MWCNLSSYVTRSREISLKSNIFSFLFDWSAHWERYILLKTPLNLTSGSKVMSNWRILKTIEHERNSFHFLAISRNQCPRLILLDYNTYVLYVCVNRVTQEIHVNRDWSETKWTYIWIHLTSEWKRQYIIFCSDMW